MHGSEESGEEEGKEVEREHGVGCCASGGLEKEEGKGR